MSLIDAIIKHQKRIWITIGALVLFRIGTFIPIPGIDIGLLPSYTNLPIPHSDWFYSALGHDTFLNLFTGDALARVSIFALGVFPYILATVLVQMALMILRGLITVRPSASGVETLTRICAAIAAAAIGIAIAHGLITSYPYGSHGLVTFPEPLFYATTAVSLACGTLALLWLSAKITTYGIGHGISVIILAGMLASLAPSFMFIAELRHTGAISFTWINVLFASLAFLAVIAIFVQRTRHATSVYRSVGQIDPNAKSNSSGFILRRLNAAGALPIISALTVVLLPLEALELAGLHMNFPGAWLFYPGTAWSLVVPCLLIFVCAYLAASMQSNAREVAEDLQARGVFIPGLRPGSKIEAYLRRSTGILTTFGAASLAVLFALTHTLIFETNRSRLEYSFLLIALLCAISAEDILHRLCQILRGRDTPPKNAIFGLSGSVELEIRNN